MNNIVIHSTIQEKYSQNLEIKGIDGVMIQLQKNKGVLHTPLI